MASKKKPKTISKKLKFSRIQVVSIGVILVAAAIAVALFAHASSAKCINSTFGQGSSGACVSDIQYMLNAFNNPTIHGLSPISPQLPINGQYTAATAFTVGAYQKYYRSYYGTNVDGVVGPKTWAAFCNNYAISGEISSSLLPIRQAAVAAVNAGCTLHVGSGQ